MIVNNTCEKIIEAYNLGFIEQAEQYAMDLFRHRTVCDETAYKIARVFNYARNERRISNTCFLEYFPAAWKADLNTLCDTFDIVNNILNVIVSKRKDSIDSTSEELILKEFCVSTGFSNVLTDMMSGNTNTVSIIAMSRYIDAIEKSVDSRFTVVNEIAVGSQQCIHSSELLNVLDSDNIIIAIDILYAKQEIKRFLAEQGYCISKVLDFFEILYSKVQYRIVDRVMHANSKKNCGLILGLSHISMGVIPEKLKGNFVNCAVHAQDLYYNLEALRYCRRKYSDRLSDIDTVIIDMFDYTYFNFDTSLSIMAFNYYAEYGGGDYGQHNYYKKENTSNSYAAIQDYIIKRSAGALEESKANENLWNKLIPDFVIDNQSELSGNEWFLERNIEDIRDFTKFEEAQLPKGLLAKRHEETIAENKRIFYELLDEIYDINSKMRVILVIVPQYREIRELYLERMNPWKTEFYSIINKAKETYPIELYDLKNHIIGNDPSNYYDLDHLNYYGAVKFTEVINMILDGKVEESCLKI